MPSLHKGEEMRRNRNEKIVLKKNNWQIKHVNN